MTALCAATTQTSLQVLRGKNQGPGTRGSQDLVPPKASNTNPKLPHNKKNEKLLNTEED